MICGIICAMEEEIALLRQDLCQPSETKIAGRIFYRGTLYGKSVVLAQSHVGKVAAALTASLMIDRLGVHMIICSGTAGGIDPHLQVGDAVIADFCVQHDFKLPEAWGAPFRIPGIELSYLPTSARLIAAAKKAVEHYMQEAMFLDIPAAYQQEFGMEKPRVLVGTIASADEFVHTPERRKWLQEHVENLSCVEMEGAAIAQVCYEFGVPYTIVRVISDSANSNSVVDFDRFIEHAARYFTRGVVQAVLRGNPLDELI